MKEVCNKGATVKRTDNKVRLAGADNETHSVVGRVVAHDILRFDQPATSGLRGVASGSHSMAQDSVA